MATIKSIQEADTNDQRLLWILYSDLNSRFDTLIEESAHLQDTIRGLIQSSNVASEIISKCCQPDEKADFCRPLVGKVKQHPRYHNISIRDRAFLSLWNILGAIITGLIENQRRHTEEYRKVISILKQYRDKKYNESSNEILFWYIETRGYFLNIVFVSYTAQIEHTHEKLIHMLENQAGTLPAPILFRRWNSAVYGEFLSEYSRQVNWEANKLIKLLPGYSKISGPPPSLTHTWTHFPTSLTRYFDIELQKQENQTSSPCEYRFAIIQSAYFYLEQPILFPLLYHECAHINFPRGINVSLDHNDFFGAKTAAVESLRLANPESLPLYKRDNFWDQFTEEVWADAMALALGGRAYLLPLVLQVFGASGGDRFSHFRVDGDSTYPFNKLATPEHRKYEVTFPALEESYFWEARLLIACAVLERLPTDVTQTEQSVLSQEVSQSVVRLIEHWQHSGRDAFHKDKTSPEHAGFWEYRIDLNRWVSETIKSYLLPVVDKLSTHQQVCDTYDIRSQSTQKHINIELNAYRNKYTGNTAHRSINVTRLENVAADLKWELSLDIFKRINDSQSDITYWITNFASWARNESSVAYRLALEASRVRMSIQDELADMLEEIKPASEDRFKAHRFWKNLPESVKSRLIKYPRLHRRILRHRGLTRSKSNSLENDLVVSELRKLIDESVDTVMSTINNSKLNEGRDSGTLTLGVIRAGEFAFSTPDGIQSTYFDALERVATFFKGAATSHANNLKRESSPMLNLEISSSTAPLVGEYQFLSYTANSTPVERDHHPKNVPLLLTKPRFIVHIGGLPLKDLLKNCENLWGRVALIRFKYKWKWLDLLTKLDNEHKKSTIDKSNKIFDDYSIYLSSAWEDVILITSHEKPEKGCSVPA